MGVRGVSAPLPGDPYEHRGVPEQQCREGVSPSCVGEQKKDGQVGHSMPEDHPAIH